MFEDWYKIYPNKKAPGQARRAYEKLNPDEELERKMIEAVKLQIEDRKRTDQFRPNWKHPSTWLRGECWEDEIYLVKPKLKTSTQVLKELENDETNEIIEKGRTLGIEWDMKKERWEDFERRVRGE